MRAGLGHAFLSAAAPANFCQHLPSASLDHMSSGAHLQLEAQGHEGLHVATGAGHHDADGQPRHPQPLFCFLHPAAIPFRRLRVVLRRRRRRRRRSRRCCRRCRALGHAVEVGIVYSTQLGNLLRRKQ